MKFSFPYNIKLDGVYRVDSIYNGIKLSKGNETIEINYTHHQDCCENVYADWSHLEDTGFLNKEFNSLLIEGIENFGFSINGFAVACYNEQNGYYSSDLEIVFKHSSRWIDDIIIDIGDEFKHHDIN